MSGCGLTSDKKTCQAKQNDGGERFYDCSNTTDAGEKACNMIFNSKKERLCIFILGVEAEADDKEPGGDEEGDYVGYAEKDRCGTYQVCLTGTTAQECGALGVEGCEWDRTVCQEASADFGYGGGGGYSSYGNGGGAYNSYGWEYGGDDGGDGGDDADYGGGWLWR